MFLLWKWYKTSELGLRAAILSCGLMLSNAFGSLIASAVLDSMEGVLGYAAWRWYVKPRLYGPSPCGLTRAGYSSSRVL